MPASGCHSTPSAASIALRRSGEANRALQSLVTLRAQAAGLPTNRRGGVNVRAESSLRAQLDAVASGLRWGARGNRSANGY